MKDSYLKQLKKLAEAATPGPWLERQDLDYYQAGTYLGHGPMKYVPRKDGRGNELVSCSIEEVEYFADDVVRIEGTDADQDFIAEARTAVPQLIAEVERLREELRLARRGSCQ